jgi:hypothetical protein
VDPHRQACQLLPTLLAYPTNCDVKLPPSALLGKMSCSENALVIICYQDGHFEAYQSH